MQLSFIQIATLVLTIVLTVLPGILAARKIKSADDYNVGGRSAGVGLVAGSIIGTIVGGAATVGTAQLGFILGLTAWWFTLGSGIALIIMALFYAVPLRSSGLTTVSEFLSGGYGKAGAYLASVSSSAGIFFSIVASTLTALSLVAGLFQVSYGAAGAILVLVVLGLVFFGGITGGGMAGIIKILLIFAAIFTGGIMAYGDIGAWQGLTAAFPEAHWYSLFGRGLEDGLFSLASMLVGVISTQTYVQAVFSAKDTRTAAAGCVTAALIVIPVGLPSVMIGMYMRHLHPEISSINALPFYLAAYLPDWLGGIGLAALLLSAFGSIAGLALGIGTMLSRDIIANLWRRASSYQLLWTNRCCVLLVTLLAVFFVLEHLDSSVLEWNYLSMALRGSGIFLPLTCAIFFRGRCHRGCGLLAIAGGIFIACTWEQLAFLPMNALFAALFVNCIFLALGLVLGPRRG